MARKPLLDATSRPETSYSTFTQSYRSSSNIEDRRNKNRALQPSRTPRDTKATVYDIMFPGQFSGTTGRDRSGDGSSTPDDYSFGPAEGGPISRTTPGSGWPSVTSTQQSATRKVDAEEAVRKTHFERN